MKYSIPSATVFTAFLISASTAQDLTVSGSLPISAADGEPFDAFGNVIAFSSDLGVLAVGVSGSDSAEASDTGAVFLFARDNGSANGWGFLQKLTASDASRGDNFGSALAFAGGTLAVGARERGLGQGAVYLFSRGVEEWSEFDTLTASEGKSGDNFGTAVAASGDVLAVGSPGADVSGKTDQGLVTVYERTAGSPDFVETRTLLDDNDARSGDKFGTSLAMAGNILVAGAPDADVGGVNASGKAVAFRRVAGFGWTIPTDLLAPVATERDRFGSIVALSSGTIAVGQPAASFDGDNSRGRVQLFRISTGAVPVWELADTLMSSDGEGGDRFGEAIAMSGDTLAVGAVGADIVGAVDRGAVYLFRPDSGNRFTQRVKFTSSDGVAREGFGSGIAASGEEVAVGAGAASVGVNNKQGKAYVFRTDLYTPWAIGEFGASVVADGSLQPTIWGRSADPDKDGISNTEEAYHGSDPNIPDNRGPQSIDHAGTNFVYRWQRDPDHLGIGGLVRWSPDLTNWYSSGAGPAGDARTITLRDRGRLLAGGSDTLEASIPTNGSDRVFLRLNFQ